MHAPPAVPVVPCLTCVHIPAPSPYSSLQLLDDQFSTGRLYAAISSRPGQVRMGVWVGHRLTTFRPPRAAAAPSPLAARCSHCCALATPLLGAQCGRADGYILEGRELEFYLRKMQKKKVRGGGGVLLRRPGTRVLCVIMALLTIFPNVSLQGKSA